MIFVKKFTWPDFRAESCQKSGSSRLGKNHLNISREVLGLAIGLGLKEVATVCRCIIKRNINSATVGSSPKRIWSTTLFQVLSLLEGPGALDPGVASDCLGWVASHLAEVRAVYQNDYLMEFVKKSRYFYSQA